MYEVGDLRKGLKIEINGDPHVVVDFEFVKPGKGQALYKCKLKNMVSGSQFDQTFRSGDKLNKANLEEHKMEYLYTDGDSYCFMDNNTYEQIFVSPEQMGDCLDLLKENTQCDVLFFDNKPIGVTLPNFVELKVVEAEPWVKGDTASGSNKPATLETGCVLPVPPFIEEGDLLKIDTRSKAYVERVKK
ncbi:MAG: elongation factor P [Thermodesulfobacteriota bacterium]|nr:elongation factor P [Thermodesulfobacteriota bacterium]